MKKKKLERSPSLRERNATLPDVSRRFSKAANEGRSPAPISRSRRSERNDQVSGAFEELQNELMEMRESSINKILSHKDEPLSEATIEAKACLEVIDHILAKIAPLTL